MSYFIYRWCRLKKKNMEKGLATLILLLSDIGPSPIPPNTGGWDRVRAYPSSSRITGGWGMCPPTVTYTAGHWSPSVYDLDLLSRGILQWIRGWETISDHT